MNIKKRKINVPAKPSQDIEGALLLTAFLFVLLGYGFGVLNRGDKPKNVVSVKDQPMPTVNWVNDDIYRSKCRRAWTALKYRHNARAFQILDE